jgi:CspA family cold shock protein
MARKNRSHQDETCYCAQCGISFVWTVEEQNSATAELPLKPPLYCSGCRALLPVAGRERGIVKWYHRRKGYGFIVRRGAEDIYVNRSALRCGALLPDMLVEFGVGHNQQGPVADEVVVLERSSLS